MNTCLVRKCAVLATMLLYGCAQETDRNRTATAANNESKVGSQSTDTNGAKEVLEVINQHKVPRADQVAPSIKERKPLLTIKIGDDIEMSSLALSRDGSQVAGGCRYLKSIKNKFGGIEKQYAGNGLKIWDGKTGEERASLAFRADLASILFLAFSPDGRRIAFVEHLGKENMIKVFDIESKKDELVLERNSKSVCFLTFTPDGKKIVSAAQFDNPRIWDATTGKLISKLPVNVSYSAFHLGTARK